MKMQTINNENIKIKDNFLEQEKFDEIQNIMAGKAFPWYFRYRHYSLHKYSDAPADELDKFQFAHVFYDHDAAVSSFFKLLFPILELLQPVSVFMIRANLLTRIPILVENPFHSDMEFLLEEKRKQWTTSIFYMNTNDGYTAFEDGMKVESVANRMVSFPANTKHMGTSCTDKQKRIIINFNYFIQ